jgi:hypothetical protein
MVHADKHSGGRPCRPTYGWVCIQATILAGKQASKQARDGQVSLSTMKNVLAHLHILRHPEYLNHRLCSLGASPPTHTTTRYHHQLMLSANLRFSAVVLARLQSGAGYTKALSWSLRLPSCVLHKLSPLSCTHCTIDIVATAAFATRM